MQVAGIRKGEVPYWLSGFMKGSRIMLSMLAALAGGVERGRAGLSQRAGSFVFLFGGLFSLGWAVYALGMLVRAVA